MSTLGICLNLSNLATSQWSALPFTSMVKAGGRVLAAGPTGLFVMGGDSDAGGNIDARIVLPETDFGVSNRKALRSVDFGLDGGPLEVGTLSDGQHARSYLLDEDVARRAPLGQRLYVGSDSLGRYWTISVENRDGSDFEIDAMEVSVVVRGK